MAASIVLVRGLPGSGKTTFVECFVGDPMISADDYMIDKTGCYCFDPSRLGEVHQKCLKEAEVLLKEFECVIVANTFSMRWEMQPYLDLAKANNAWHFVVDLFDNGLADEELATRNSHGVPIEGIQRMRARWEHDWKSGSPLPPKLK